MGPPTPEMAVPGLFGAYGELVLVKNGFAGVDSWDGTPPSD